MRTLLIDNYDSYTFNLYQLLAAINGELPLVVRNDQLDWAELSQLAIDNVVISPGPGHPANPADFGLCSRVLQDLNRPILGICLGHQGLGLVFGGQVIHAPTVCHGLVSPIYHRGSELFADIPSPFGAVRYHSLIVDRATLPEVLEVTAWTDDDLIMGLRHRHRPLWGVQFHPESICTDYGQQLLKNFHTLSRRLGFPRSPSPPPTISPQNTGKASQLPRSSPAAQPSKWRVFSRQISLFRDPEAVFVHLYGQQPYAFWLDSSQVEPGLARFSFMGDLQGHHSLRIQYNHSQQTLWVTQNDQVTRHRGHIFDYLQQQLDQRQCQSEALPFDFNGGFVGYFGYELKPVRGEDRGHPSALPDAAFLLADRLIGFDHCRQTTYLLYLGHPQEVEQAHAWFDQIAARLEHLPPAPPLPVRAGKIPIRFRLGRCRQTYLADIQRCLQYLHDGESYEICLTNQIHTPLRPPPLDFYRTLRRQNPTPYAAFLKFGDYAIACSSPERFLKIDRQRWVETKPIKGTRPRGQTPAADRQLYHQLRTSQKDRAENLMVLDLLRNDLGQVCEVGSVHVPRLMQVETYTTVHQLVSTVRGRLRADLRVTDCIRAAFPGGSMTGAPKLRTMALLDDLEQATRGVYSGALGFLSWNGTADLNIVIRTAVITPDGTTIGTGGGIVALSDPEQEFEEILLKARALVQALAETVGGTVPDEFWD